ncbi:HNH endonuclease family protein [Saccharopolyspora griseoalba]|uniref:HNH endonuclease family protein n=1 Tax=Saccharopolyspora griseoalba TaxID=1431848 RepID=A0ABW2LQS7_9PSEU
MKKFTRTMLAATLTVAGASGCSLQQAMSADQPRPTAPAGDVAAALASIPVRPEGGMEGYDRDAFDVWSDHGDECDTRAVLLKQTSSTPARVNDNCTVQSGSWRDAYTGRTVTDPGDLDVDHLIPLAEAWRSGAADWPTELREHFGNDLEHGNLVVADSSANRSKGDQDPASWLPSYDRCGYVTRYIQVTAYWNQQAAATGHQLSIDPAEKQALEHELANCG